MGEMWEGNPGKGREAHSEIWERDCGVDWGSARQGEGDEPTEREAAARTLAEKGERAL